MIRFFRINDPYRLAFIFLIVLLIRVPFWFLTDWMTIPQLKWFLVGERLSFTSHLYVDVWENISPLSGGVFWMIESLFGRSLISVHILGLLLTFVQITVINFSFNERNVFEEKTFIPGLIYGILSCIFFDFYYISPILLSTTFLLLALNNILRQIEFKAKRDERILSTGIFIGLASLFYIPSCVMIIFALLIYYLFTSTVTRRYFLMIFGWVLPILITAFYYFWIDSYKEFTAIIFSVNFFKKTIFSPVGYILMLLIVPGFYTLVGSISAILGGRFTNYQSRVLQAMLVYLVGAICISLLSPDVAPNVMLFVLPPMCYLISISYSLTRRSRFAEFRIWSFLLLVISMNYITWISEMEQFEVPGSYIAQRDPRIPESVEGSILDLTTSYSAYVGRPLATKYLNWDISMEEWDMIDDPSHLLSIMFQIRTGSPKIVIDSQENHFMRLRQRSPRIREIYVLKENYFLREEGEDSTPGSY